ncbi:nucleoside-diphosphate kinase [Candidatus Thorarchaeota archaeon]|nr:MAG: nucleoside-diphosphate kinase [Candidatus Thorarchaeota archaeon]
MEQSLVIVKPDGTLRRRVGALVIKILLDKGYKIRAFKEMKVPRSLAEKHYDIHKERPFFPWLVQFITSGRVLVMVFEGEDVIQGIRDALGATFVEKASPDSLRGKYGLIAGVNIAHASDSPDTAKNEIQLWTEHGGLEFSEDAEERAREYVQKYADSDADYTEELRSVIHEAISKEKTGHEVVESLKRLLSKDAEGIEEQEIEALASAIHATIEEQVEKAK